MKEPSASCPYLDSAITEIEEARKIHSSLREWGHHWKEQYEELDRVSSNEIDRLKDEIKALEDEIFDLKNSMKDLQQT